MLDRLVDDGLIPLVIAGLVGVAGVLVLSDTLSPTIVILPNETFYSAQQDHIQSVDSAYELIPIGGFGLILTVLGFLLYQFPKSMTTPPISRRNRTRRS